MTKIIDENEEYILSAVEHFRTLLNEQIAREKKMESDEKKIDYTKLDKIVIGIIPGDGIGPVISSCAERVLSFLLDDEIISGKIEIRKIEGLTIENRTSKGKAIPDDVIEKIKTCDVILKGPTTTPKGGNLESANVAMRRELDLFANVRPICIPALGIDWTFFRENTEGEYVLGSKGIEIPGALAFDFKVTTVEGTKRIARAAFDFARKNGKHKVAIVTKANIMKKTDGLFSEICHEIAKDYPEIAVDDYYIDIMTANLINEKIRSDFEVFLLPNLYGDIITDEAAQIQGGVGTAGSANIGNKYAMFEPVHGSAPRMVEEGLSAFANPTSIMKASEMMLRHIGRKDKADALLTALDVIGEKGNCHVPTGYKDGASCDEFIDELIGILKNTIVK